MTPKKLAALLCLAFAMSAWCAAASAPVAPKIDFISVETARQAMLDETNSPFVSLMEEHEMAVFGLTMTGKPIEQQRAAFSKKLAASITPFSTKEKKMLADCIAKVSAWLDGKYPLLAKQPWKICKTKMKIPPHTRADCIVFPADMVAQYRDAISGGDGNRSLLPELLLARLLLHEQVHVVQRMVMSAKNWNALYAKWGFAPVKSIPLDDPWIKSHKLTNPDGPDVRWLWREDTGGGQQRIWWPLLVTKNSMGNSKGGSPLDYILLEVEETGGALVLKRDANGVPKFKTMRNNAAMRRLMPTFDTPPYHPHEAAADMIDELFFSEIHPPRKQSATQAAFRKQLAKDLEVYFQE